MGDHLIANRLLLWVLVGLCSGWPAAAVAQSETRGLRADRFDVALTLLADGSVDVRETVVFRFTEKTFTRVEREIPVHRFDGVIDVRASLDGHPVGPGKDGESERVRIRKGRDTLRVTWTFPETIDRTRTFTLEYRAMGALSVANGRATMDWLVLPARHRYVIDEARVEWRVPSTAVRVEPTRLDDPRWTSTALPDGWAASRQGVGLDETVKLTDAFDLKTMALAVPAWQDNAFRARQMAPAFVITAITLLVCGAGVIGMTWFRYYVPAGEPRAVQPATVDSWPPAIGTSLIRGWVGVGLAQTQATLFDLARRGLLKIDQSSDSPQRFEIVLPLQSRTKGTVVKPHEQVLIDALWLQLKNGRLELREGWRHLSRALGKFRRAVIAEMEEAGLVDRERRAARKAMRVAGIVVVLVGLAGMIIFGIAFGHLGDLPLLVPASVVICGVAFLIASCVMSVLSPAGRAAAAEWRVRRSWIKTAVKGRMNSGDVAQWFPVAAGFGLAQAMLKASDGPVEHQAAFKWLGQLNDPGAALAVIVAATSATSHSGGASGGGSAAGGSSSAS